MAEVFNHRYELTVGRPQELIERHNAFNVSEGTQLSTTKTTDRVTSVITGGYVDYVTVPNGAKVITEPIQMEADIKYSIGQTSGNPQTATIKVFNVSQDTLNFIEANAAVILKAGYQTDSEIPVIFAGQIERTFSTKVGPDIVTTMICKEASNVLKNVRFVANYPEGQTYTFILNQLIKKFQDNGVPLGRFIQSRRSLQTVQEAVSYSGKLSTKMSDICNSIDYTWFTSKGKLYLQPVELDRPLEFIEPSITQIIGTVRPNDDKTAKASNDKESRPKGVNIDMYLNGEVGIHTYIRLGAQFETFSGDYRPDSVRFRLNWQNGPWQTSIESQRVKEFATNTAG